MVGFLRAVPIFLCCLLAASSLAASVRSDGPVVIVNEVSVLTLRATVAGHTPSERAVLVAKRLNAFSEPVKLTAKPYGKNWILVAPEGTLMQIDAADAAANGTALPALAASWLKSIQSALDLPPLKLEKSTLRLKVGTTASVALIGRETGDATFLVSDDVPVKVERRGNTLDVTALQKGDSTVTVRGVNGTATLEVRCQNSAATFPKAVSAEVVGTSTSPDAIADIIRGAVVTQTQLEPGAKLAILNAPTVNLAMGETKSVTVRLRATAPNAFEATGEVEVVVRNLALRREPESELWYCNNPESVRHPQELFRASLRSDVPVRMLYHHMNASSQPFTFRVDILNPSDLPAKVVVIPGDSKPDKNPVLAGLMAAEPFFKGWLKGNGEVITIPPRSSVPLTYRRLTPIETGSGLCYLRLLPDGPAELPVVAAAVEPVGQGPRWAAAYQSPTPWHEVPAQTLTDELITGPISEYVFTRPFVDENVTYRVGGSFGFLYVGQNAIERKTVPGRRLDGNFGVTYNISARAENPSNKVVSVEVVFEASAGYSGALFVVDGEFRTIRPIQPKAEVQLAQFRLDPGQSRDVKITTIPLSGSCYPATLAVRMVHSITPIIK